MAAAAAAAVVMVAVAAALAQLNKVPAAVLSTQTLHPSAIRQHHTPGTEPLSHTLLPAVAPNQDAPECYAPVCMPHNLARMATNLLCMPCAALHVSGATHSKLPQLTKYW